jgi:hypothetical protein
MDECSGTVSNGSKLRSHAPTGEEIILGRHGRNHTELDADTGLTTDDETRRGEQLLFH